MFSQFEFEDNNQLIRKSPLNYEEVKRLYAFTDWRFILFDDRLPREYKKLNTLSILKAFALPFIVEIPSERAIARELMERESLRTLCDFKPTEKVPEKRIFWRFRHDYSNIFSELMYKILILKKSRPISLHVTRYPGKPQVSSVGVFALEYEGVPYTAEQNQNEKWEWFDMNNLPAPLFGPTKIVIDHYLENKFPNLEWVDVESRTVKAEQPTLFELPK
jgi:hypothetical protein